MSPKKRLLNEHGSTPRRKSPLVFGGLLLAVIALTLLSIGSRPQPVSAAAVALATPTPLTIDLATIQALTVNSIATNYTLATYVQGAKASGTSATDLSIFFPPFNKNFLCDSIVGGDCGPPVDPSAGNTLNFRWLQADVTPLIFDLGTPNCQALVFPSVDHDPAVYEALEFTVWGTNDPNAFATFPTGWSQGTLTKVYGKGWVDLVGNAGKETDDNASLWSFGSSSFRYVAVYGNESIHITPEPTLAELGPDGAINNPCFGLGYFCSEDVEIDAVGRPTNSNCNPPAGACIETVNPHGKNIPPAGITLPGTKGGQNPDGFYKLGATGGVGTLQIFVVDLGSGTVFGPFANGAQIKYTQAPGATPSIKKIGSTGNGNNGQSDAIVAHITGKSDFGFFAVDSLGNRSPTVTCLVPPPPK